MDAYKLHVKIGEHEFNSEGPTEAVKEAFAIWKEMIGSVPAAPPSPPKQANGNSTGDGGDVDEERLSRLYLHDKAQNQISLKILPHGSERERDSLLLLLYGYKAIKNQHEVQVTQIIPALKQSGLRIDRIDKLATPYLNRGYLRKGGMAKGGRYSLTNAGVARAEELLNELIA